MNNDLIIIRNAKINETKIDLNIFNLKNKNQFNSIEAYISFFGEKQLMKSVYDEDINSDTIKNSELYNMYLETINLKSDNDYFKNAYRLKNNLAVIISEHIRIVRIIEDYIVEDERLVPWYYVGTEKYIADSWWETDEVIINDFNNLSFIEFLVKYKMY
ncbi:hypothetical protein [Oceanirhabdus sp. W0125-5]|uniref:hypothetical protein n=1 Tax=Oceanirhabdus sp. W0125-5 TaxID=2999116 RepID=UPI0022F2E028|nr:hypothetical protein [Oceanirhabdus sp. W0125-5]WBW95238.1 hypothetical protein OW730_16265 [Oceanirhabdus sp. W0125-5]